MKNQLLSIAEYIESLEQRLAALENANLALQNTVVALQDKIESLALTPEEPEVEVELIVPEEETEQVIIPEEGSIDTPMDPDPVAEPVASMEQEPMVESTLEPDYEPAPSAEPELEPEPTPEPVPEQMVEVTEEPTPMVPQETAIPVSSEPMVAPQPVEETTAEPAPVHDNRPVQTSLFGQPVRDIRHAISLGDRFLFQRELFANNGELMQKTLDHLNECGDMDAAMAYIERFGWNKEDATYALFINVLHRRFNG